MVTWGFNLQGFTPKYNLILIALGEFGIVSNLAYACPTRSGGTGERHDREFSIGVPDSLLGYYLCFETKLCVFNRSRGDSNLLSLLDRTSGQHCLLS